MPHPLRILITGASSGIGRALAEQYAAARHTVGAVARRSNLLTDLATQYPTITPLQGDVADAAGMDRIIRAFAEQHGGLDLVYVNAGIGQHSRDQGWNAQRCQQIAEVNILGATNTIVPAVAVMLAHGGGRIVGISSLAGSTPLPSAAAYGASKAWLTFYLDALDMDLSPHGVHCSIVMPGYVATPMVDGSDSALVTPGARRAAALIASRVARGDRIIRFPRRIALLTSIARFAPRSLRISAQERRLNKRKQHRGRHG